jgi:hypothetical protein
VLILVFVQYTRGYTAPEYAIRGELTVKADTYSFGVLVLEIISSLKNTDLTLPNEMQYLPEHVRKLTCHCLNIDPARRHKHGLKNRSLL